MTRYSFTGVSRTLTALEVSLINDVIGKLTDATEFTSGCAHGVDSAAFHVAVLAHPMARHRLVIPAARCNEAALLESVQTHDRVVILEYAQMGATNGESYMLRNDRLVAHADILLAFPETNAQQLRSGTWATIRRARRAGIGIQIHPLSAAGSRRLKRRR